MKKLAIARIGRSVGLKGEMRFFDLSDFPEQFQEGSSFESDRGTVTIEKINPQRGTVKLVGVNTPEEAKRYTNAYLYSDEESTKASIDLADDEYFWFDILGCNLYENGELLGSIKDIQRLPAADYLIIDTDKALIEEGLPKSFMVPFIDEYIKDVDIKSKKIEASGAKDILQAS
ncbi:ribosome maturation factor RimM [Nitratiruptor sp. YY09-18]|uniref:ribosome maturation factor RimM n=1 Tax=Nitratiruptor sp. YY09-18 TaxID=2724901 RepID=UPI0019164DB6|nr:ribosome maturation factor RimM [Nitratiruptor sp. YY09-18]BCD68602.1 16S rRNA processing protein RimM [Nitratiruptor sp. YY09-18]